jgi:hypothetical protein
MPGKRSDPKKLAADREAIGQDLSGRVRVTRAQMSRKKALADKQAFDATGEATLGGQFKKMMSDAAEARRIKKQGGPPDIEGSYVTGMKKPEQESI